MENQYQNQKKTPNAIGEFEVTVNEWKITKDYAGDKAINITFTFINNSEDAQSFEDAIYIKAFQDGIQLESTILEEDYDESEWLDIKQGKSIQVTQAFNVSSNSPIELEIKD